MIDVSHLTEEEHEMILAVLRRDTELKKKEEQRIEKLKKTEKDKLRLKFLTGEWFYETKVSRHRDKTNGTDIIKNSMTQRKPVTILEVTQIWPENTGFLRNETKDVFVPPELSGIIQEDNSREDPWQMANNKPSAYSQFKPRPNPFNTKPLESTKEPDGLKYTSENATKVPQITVNSHQICEESQLSPAKPYETPQSPAEDITEYPSPVRRQNKLTVRPISISKSLEDLVTQPSNESWKNDPRSGMSDGNQMLLPALDPEKMKRLSMSVPGFLQQQGIGEESDCLSMDSFCSDRRRKSSTNTNFSASSGHASLSSVSGSRMNIHGAYFGHVEVKGTIQFAINYVNKLEEFHIFIVRCRDLAAAEPKRNRSDPYVKCYLLPDKAKLGKKKTTVKKKTLNPTYNEILRYRIPLDSLKGHILNLSVWHHDMFGRNSFLGEVDVDLSEWDINNTHMMDCALKSRASAPSSPTYINHSLEKMGEMRVALRFLLQTSSKMPQTGEIQIWVKECRNLFSRRGTVDSFVKCSFLPDSNQKSRQKSRVVKKTAKPVFNHTMVYDGIRLEDLKETCVELTVWDHDRLSNHFIGGTRLGLGTGKSYSLAVNWMDSSPLEAELWKRMIESVNEWVEDTVPLRMLIMTRTVPR